LGGGGPSNVTSSTHADVPGWLVAPAQQYVGNLQNLATNSPYGYMDYNQLMNPAAAPFTPLQQRGMTDIVNAGTPFSQYAGSGLNTLQNLAQTGGGMNPFLPSYMDSAVNSLVKNYTQATAPSEMSAAMKSGAFGGSSDAEARALNQFGLGGQIGGTVGNIAEQAWGQQLGTQAQAASQLPTAAQAVFTPGQQELQTGNQQQGQGQNILNAITQGAKQMMEWPYQIMGQLGGGLSSMIGPFSGGTTVSPNMAAMGSKF
jgi:hypothetical protein